jgi:hypothetical protein
MADPVQLTDLDVITRYSIAVRSATADRDELLATLRADVAWLERGRSRSSTAGQRRTPEPADGPYDLDSDDDEAAEEAPRRAPIRRMAMPQTRRAPAGKTAAKKTTAKKTTAKKTATRRTN